MTQSPVKVLPLIHTVTPKTAGGSHLVKVFVEAVWLGDGFGNFKCQILLFCDFSHQVIHVVHAPGKQTDGSKPINVVRRRQRTSEFHTVHVVHLILKSGRKDQVVLKCFTYTFSCSCFIALAAMLMFLRTSVLVLAFSRASLWYSMVDNVPSIWVSCFS